MPAYTLGTHGFDSRLIIGSGKYRSFEQNLACAVASGAEMVTVALRRVDPTADEDILDAIDLEHVLLLNLDASADDRAAGKCAGAVEDYADFTRIVQREKGDEINAATRTQSIVEFRSKNQKKRYVP